MIAAILLAAQRRTWLGGNIGVSLLADLPRIEPDDRVVLELSSFQLFWLNEQVRWPRWAVLTNFSPNHLDWHGTVEHYAAAKQRLIRHVGPEGAVILQSGDLPLRSWATLAGDRLAEPFPYVQIPPLRVLGIHNAGNAELAATAARSAGADATAVSRGLSAYPGLPHRLVHVADVNGRQFYNDSKSTTPAATLAALESLMIQPVWLLLGGADKQVALTGLTLAAGKWAAGAAVYGAVGPILDQYLAKNARRLPRVRTETLDEAFAWCWAKSRPGDAILLSPGCSSLDQFRDYAERGERFEQLVAQLRSSCQAT
jgi:UDP-N-acetylmuramoylalanine--D-glutamate ligase